MFLIVSQMRQIFHLHWKILVCWRNYDWMLLFSCIIIIHANNFIIIIYVTVVSPLQRSLVQEASVTQGHALQVAEAWRIATHDQNCRSEGIVFVPLAVETLGGWSSLAVDTIKAFSRLQDQRLGIAMNFSSRRHLFPSLSGGVTHGCGSLDVIRSCLPPWMVSSDSFRFSVVNYTADITN